jgi:AbrB family looped-hinge helix DNA binding protein
MLMKYFTTVTTKGQILLRKEVREKMKIAPRDTVVVEIVDDEVTISPTKDILDLAGTFHPPTNADKTPEEAREAFEERYTRP